MTWDRVRRELDEWAREGRTAQFWWRDDDAQDASPHLSRVLETAARFDVTIGLSVIPAKLRARLVKALEREAHAQVLVHGFAHENHARPRQAKRELGGGRRLEEIVEDLAQGLGLMRAGFGRRLLPVLVPPWNRIAPRAVARLPALGYRGISTWKPREKAHPVPKLLQVNTHLDVIDWRRGRIVKDERMVAGLLLRKLRWRRKARARASEPLGLLTHHAYWDATKERIITNLLEATRRHPAVQWHSPATAFEV
jgi:hypothetical protein